MISSGSTIYAVVIIIANGISHQNSNPGSIVSISFCANALRKGIDPSVLLPVINL